VGQAAIDVEIGEVDPAEALLQFVITNSVSDCLPIIIG
jgi:hypothetical protein